jgi:hypothetical protein
MHPSLHEAHSRTAIKDGSPKVIVMKAEGAGEAGDVSSHRMEAQKACREWSLLFACMFFMIGAMRMGVQI